MQLFDPTFGVNPTVLAVAYALERFSGSLETSGSSYANIMTSTWYNGRERGICWSYSPFLGSPVLRIVCIEHRNSDQICMLQWVDDCDSLNPPVGSDPDTLHKAYRGGDKYNVAAAWPYSKINDAAQWILQQLQAFTTKHKEAEKLT